MGGVHSGTHNLGEALWVHERQRQKCHRESTRCESNSAQSTQDRRKLLKRTRSLAVISEDESRQDREAVHYRLGQSTFDLPRRHQLIPRAKLIDRNSLKDRLSKSQQHLSDSYEKFNETKSYYSRSTCGLHSIPAGLSSFRDPLPYSRGNRGSDPDRLNILDWPKPPRRYCSVQALDTVSGLVDIVEDNWPIEGNRSIDCIYTQVKRKRKEHRSLDSILFEDDGELEYFDVLNLLPLSNVRLEFDEEDAKNNNLRQGSEISAESTKFRSLEPRESSASSNATDEEKCKENTTKEVNSSFEDTQNSQECENSKEFDSSQEDSSSQHSTEELTPDYRDSLRKARSYSRTVINEHAFVTSVIDQRGESDVGFVTPANARADQESDRKIEQAEDHKSIWISDSDEPEDMSRRPQVLKIVDNDVTKRRHRQPTIEIDSSEEAGKDPKGQNNGDESTNRAESVKSPKGRKVDEVDATSMNGTERNGERGKAGTENTKCFIERQTVQKGAARTKQSEGRFERIVKETSNILGKACNVVKGSLGFEARSESSDLGLGSESGSESRRRSVDDGIGDEQTGGGFIGKQSPAGEGKKSHGNLTRSRSYVDSIECQEDGAEFDHVRYKIIKSHVFSKNMFSSGKGDVTYEGLMQYLREYSFQELLLDNNVVIIEPVRAETVERKPSPTGKAKSDAGCKISGATQKKSDGEAQERNNEKADSVSSKSPKQSSIRKHFFYHPIRVNRELIDEELPDPDTVRNVRRMFENTLRTKNNSAGMHSPDCKNRESVSMKDLTNTEDNQIEEISEKVHEETRSRCSSRAKDLTKLFESMEKSAPPGQSILGSKDAPDSPRSESKTRILAQSFEARSGHTSPSDSNSSKNKANRYHHHHHHHHNWDAGSISSGVSSDYPDTDVGSGAHCTSSSDEEADCHDDEGNDTRGPGHYVSQDVLKKIRECGTSVTYYGGKVVNTCNGPLISPLMGNRFNRTDRSNDYVKFRLVKSNSCDSRLELTGRLIEGQSNHARNPDKAPELSRYAIAETPSIEITTLEKSEKEDRKDENLNHIEAKREPPVVIGLEPKREDRKETTSFKAEFKLGSLDDAKSNYPDRFVPSALTRWQINETNWKTGDDFGKMEFEEFEVLEDSLNGNENQRVEAAS